MTVLPLELREISLQSYHSCITFKVLAQLMDKNPRLSSATMTIYGELMDNLKKIIAHDSNINVVIAALNVVTRLARGLRERFACFISMMWVPMLDKAKDKKATVRAALGDALDAVSDACAPDRLAKDLCEHLVKPNPTSKQCLCSFLTRYFVRQMTVSMEFTKAVVPVAVKLASDSDPAVRDAACSVLGSARRLLARGLDAFLAPLVSEKAKLDKIEEYCGEATKQHAEFLASRPQSGAQSSGLAAGDPVESSSGSVATVSDAVPNDIDPWTLMDPTDVVQKMRKDFDELIASKKWQERKEAVDSLLSIMESAPRVAMSPELQVVMSTLVKVLEKDVNINVSSTAAKVLAKMAASMRTDFAVMVPKIMPIAFDKLKEKKAVLRNELVGLCDAASTTTSLENYSEAVCGGLTKANPQSRAQTAMFVGRLLARHDASTVPVEAVKQITPDLVKCSTDADAEVRESTFRAMAAVLRCVGEAAARRLFGEVSEDKLRMSKITENLEKLREEFGDKAAPEIVRLHGPVAKPKPLQPSSAPNRAASAAQTMRKAPATSRVAPIRPLTATSRPSTPDSKPVNRVAPHPTSAPRRSNVVTTVSERETAPTRAPLSTRPVQQVAPRRLSAPLKSAVPRAGLTPRGPVKPVHAPNVVRSSTNTTRPASGPVRVANNATNGVGQAVNSSTGPLRVQNNTTNGVGQAMNSSTGPSRATSGLPRSNSGLRPPTAITRTGGVLRLSRPSSPSK